MSELTRARLGLSALTVYRGIIGDETAALFLPLLEAAERGDAASFCARYGAFFASLSSAQPGVDFAVHLEERIRFDDNAFTRAAARAEAEIAVPLRRAARSDLAALAVAAGVSAQALKAAAQRNATEEERTVIDRLPDYAACAGLLADGAENAATKLEAFHRENGFGKFARYGAFRWEGSLRGVAVPDPVRLCDLKEYDYERGVVADNTRDFVEGAGGGNLLLYGDRGTGKSSTVKALAAQYRAQGLRIVEVPKERIGEFPAITAALCDIPLRFLLFLDDLSFAYDDASFSALKSVLEGGVAARPENCRIYATSNRRHLIQESFSERNADDVHAGDTMQEKLSLADRFDRTVNFFAPDQTRYLAIVRALMKDCGAECSADELELGAVRWAIQSGGRSPRAAKQYVEWAVSRVRRGESVLP